MMRGLTRPRAAVLGLAATLIFGAHPSAGETTADTLLDRVQIEDMIVRYYAHLGGTDAKAYGAYYTEDGVFEVNGEVYEGRDAIVALYEGLGGGPSEESGPLLHMVLSNAVIDVAGDTATASFIWTGVINDNPVEPPTIREQGREYDYLVKRDGKWLIKKRVVIADSGLPESMLDTWKQELDYDIMAE